MKTGTITQASSATSVEVEYELWVSGRDDAGSRIRIGGDPVPRARFMGNPASVFPGDLNYVLETAGGVTIHVFFRNSNGEFTCTLADEARAALSADG